SARSGATGRAGATGQGNVAELVYWTEPYTFYTAKAPGMTAAMAFAERSGRLSVVGVDLLLTDVSTFTTRLRVGEHGAVMVLTDGSRVIGLPRDPRYLDAAGQRNALLKRPDELEMRVPADGSRLLARPPPGGPRAGPAAERRRPLVGRGKPGLSGPAAPAGDHGHGAGVRPAGEPRPPPAGHRARHARRARARHGPRREPRPALQPPDRGPGARERANQSRRPRSRGARGLVDPGSPSARRC